MRSRTLAIVLVATAIGVAGAASEAGPYQVRRALHHASVVRTAPVLATASLAPFDDEPGVLGDGQTYFYVVDDPTGSSVVLSVHKHPSQDTVRLGFDDDDPSSADVDTAASSVTAAPTTIPADGVSTATLVIVPRDSAGLPLGAGLDVTIDVASLSPGLAASGIVDRGDGSYVIDVVSWSAGSGLAVITVEGRTLDEAPSLVYEAAALQGSGGDLQIVADELQDLIDADPRSSASTKLYHVTHDLLKAIDELQDIPADERKATDRIKKAIKDLEDAAAAGLDSAAADDYMERLVRISREIALQAILNAIGGGGDPTDIDDSWFHLFHGDAQLASKDWADAAHSYADAAKHAEQA